MSASLIMKARETFAGLLGLMFKGRRDLYEVFGYSRELTYDQLLAKYIRQGIASRIVNAPADALWTQPPIIMQGDEEVILPLAPMLDIWDAFRRADILAGIGEYSIVVIGTANTSLEEMATPLNKSAGLITFMQPYSQREATIHAYETDITSSQYMKPSLYRISPRTVGTNSVTHGQSFMVHYSRVIHFAENALVNTVFGIPRLLKVWNDLEDLAKVSGGSSECFWLAGNRGLQVDIDKDMQLEPQDEIALADEVAEYVDGMSRIIKTKGVKVNNLGSDAPNPSANFDMLINLMSGASGIPKRILIGSEQGQLASEQDRFNWAERIQERRTSFGEPVCVFQFIKRLVEAGLLPDKVYTCKWPIAFQMTPKEHAEEFAIRARAYASTASASRELPTESRNFLSQFS